MDCNPLAHHREPNIISTNTRVADTLTQSLTHFQYAFYSHLEAISLIQPTYLHILERWEESGECAGNPQGHRNTETPHSNTNSGQTQEL